MVPRAPLGDPGEGCPWPTPRTPPRPIWVHTPLVSSPRVLPPCHRAPVPSGGCAVPPRLGWVAPGPPWLGCPTPVAPPLLACTQPREVPTPPRVPIEPGSTTPHLCIPGRRVPPPHWVAPGAWEGVGLPPHGGRVYPPWPFGRQEGQCVCRLWPPLSPWRQPPPLFYILVLALVCTTLSPSFLHCHAPWVAMVGVQLPVVDTVAG